MHYMACGHLYPAYGAQSNAANAVRIHVTTVPFVGRGPTTRGTLGVDKLTLHVCLQSRLAIFQALVTTPGKAP